MKAHPNSMFSTKNGVYVISATKLAAFNDCLAGFFLRYVFRYPIQPHPSTLIGSAVHRTIDYRWRYFKEKGEDVYPIEPVYDAFLTEAQREQREDVRRRAEVLGVDVDSRGDNRGDSRRDNRGDNQGDNRGDNRTNDSIKDQDRRKGLAMAVLYHLNPEEVPEHTEYEFIVPYPNAREPFCYLYGFYDQLYPWGFIDLKSNYTLPTVASLAANIQFILYAYVFEQVYDKPLIRGYWYHLRTGQKVAFYPLQEDQRRLLDDRLKTITRFLYMIDTDAQRRGITVPPSTDIEIIGNNSTAAVTPSIKPISTRRDIQPYVKSYFQAVLGDIPLPTGERAADICRWCTTTALCRQILSFYYRL